MHGTPGEELLRLCVLQAHAHLSRPTGIPIYSVSVEVEAECKLELKAREVGCALPQHQQILASSTSPDSPYVHCQLNTV